MVKSDKDSPQPADTTVPGSRTSGQEMARVAPDATPVPAQPDAGLVSADSADEANAMRHCANCERDVMPGGKGSCPECGRFLKGHEASVTHGAHRAGLSPERITRREQRKADIYKAFGGEKNINAILREWIEDFVSACSLRDHLAAHLDAEGPMTLKGTRRAAMDLYLEASGRVERLGERLRVALAEVNDGDTSAFEPITEIKITIVRPQHDYDDPPAPPIYTPQVIDVQPVAPALPPVPAALPQAAPLTPAATQPAPPQPTTRRRGKRTQEELDKERRDNCEMMRRFQEGDYPQW